MILGVGGERKKWSGSWWLWEKEKWWTSVSRVTLNDSFYSAWSSRLGSQWDLSGCKFFCVYFYPTVYGLQGRFLASPGSSSHWALNWTWVSWLELGVSLFPLWEQERCCGEESGPDHSGKVSADGGKAGLSTNRLSGTERAWEQAAAQRPGERSQASPAGGAASEAEGGKDTTTRHRPGA